MLVIQAVAVLDDVAGPEVDKPWTIAQFVFEGKEYSIG